MILTRGEIGDLITALDQAIELNKMDVRSQFPPRRIDYDANDKENFSTWTQNVKMFRKLRRKLQWVEDGNREPLGPEVDDD